MLQEMCVILNCDYEIIIIKVVESATRKSIKVIMIFFGVMTV